MRGEPLCFVEVVGGGATAALLFPPEGAVVIRSAAGELEYEEGRDFLVDAKTGVVTRLSGSRLPITTREELFPAIDPDGSAFMFKRDAPDTFLMFSEGDQFQRRQVRATYAHRPGAWDGYVSRFSGADLPRTLARLRAGEPVSIAVTGDSISEGYNASGFIGVPPHQPAYVPLVTAGLTQAYGSRVALHNFASAGWTADHGLADVARVAAVSPDLVIVAYGMNDAGYATAEEFSANVASIRSEIRHAAPAAEFILVSPMLPNPDWHYPVMERFASYRDALADLCGRGTVQADVTTMWRDLLRRKSVYDLTGNGVNHPNDFGHRVYAEVIASLLT